MTSLGGDFGIQGCVNRSKVAALTGLFKAILIESWVQGFRTFPIKVLDTSRHDSPAQIVDHIWQELAVPSFDLEVSYCGGERHVVRAIANRLKPRIRPVVSSLLALGSLEVALGFVRVALAASPPMWSNIWQPVMD